jgi:hypothetical protein
MCPRLVFGWWVPRREVIGSGGRDEDGPYGYGNHFRLLTIIGIR